MSSSIIDHFCLSPNLFQLVIEADLIHDSQNLSNHSPIFMKIDLGNVNIHHVEPVQAKTVNWAKASDEAKQNYQTILSGYLSASATTQCCRLQ